MVPKADATGDPAAFGAGLQAFEGRSSGPPNRAPDPVNVPMIRHFVEAVGDDNPIYLDEQAGANYGHGGLVAPPAMLQAWTMRGLRRHLAALAPGRHHTTSSRFARNAVRRSPRLIRYSPLFSVTLSHLQ